MIKHIIYLVISIAFLSSCRTNDSQNREKKYGTPNDKQAILNVLNGETKAAFQRDYKAWTTYWIHRDDISKTYIDFPENSFSESRGWEEISTFVKTFFNKHPQPEPIPDLLQDINVRIYGTGAWVNFEQQDSLRGRKYETRLMEKEGNKWKIAGMQTTIYGFGSEE